MAFADTRVVYGARCTWWDSIQNIGHTRGPGPRLPACPHCGSVLFEMPDEARFMAGVPAYEAAGHPGYGDALRWARGKCFQNAEAMQLAYRRHMAAQAGKDEV
jgi:hypothetical protein